MELGLAVSCLLAFISYSISSYLGCLFCLDFCTLISPAVMATKAGDLATLAGNLSLSLVH